MKWRVLITCSHLQRTIEHYRSWFAQEDIEIELPSIVQQLSEADLYNMIDRFDGVIAGDDPFTAKVLEQGKRLKVIARWGIGMDSIDLEAAKNLGIEVSNTPNVFGDEGGDTVMGYILLLARQLHIIDQSVRQGKWERISGITLRGKTLGVIGVGSIGRAVVRRAIAFGMNVVGSNNSPLPEAFIEETGIKSVSLEELLSVSDFISLNCNLCEANYHLLNQKTFALMKDGVYIINTGRGGLIKEADLVKELESGKVAGVALDVFEVEPLPLDSPLRKLDNCIFGTHNSSNTKDAVMRVNELAIKNLLSGLNRGS